MADNATAAFFAKKKKSKKKFKSFNANKIDATNVTSATHVDAPEISKPTSISVTALPRDSISNVEGNSKEEWADKSFSSKSTVAPVKSKGAVSELLDMAALEERHRQEDDIVERMQVEQTRAALKRAKDGMEAEARRLKEEQEGKANQKQEAVPQKKPSIGDKWIPLHMRNPRSTANGLSSRFNSVKIGSKAVNVKDEDAFPDLSAANDLLEKQKQEQEDFKKGALRKKESFPTRSSQIGISMGLSQRPKLNLVRRKNEDKVEKSPKEEPIKKENLSKAVDVEGLEVSGPTPSTSAIEAPSPLEKPSSPVSTNAPVVTNPPPEIVKPVVTKKKKKKKDVSSFKS